MSLIKVSNGKDTFEVDEKNLSLAEKDGYQRLISVSNGKQTFDVHPSKIKDAEADGFFHEPRVSKTETALRSLAQGATGGLADELVGTTKAIKDDVFKIKNDGTRPVAKYDDFGRVTNIDELNQDTTYKEHRDEWRDQDKLSSEQNPKTAFVAELVGGIASPINKIAKGKSAAQAGLRLGGVYGFGKSEAEDLGGIATDTAIGAGAGLVLGKGIEKGIEVGAPIAGKVIKYAGDKVSALAKKIADATIESGPADNAQAVIEATKRLGASPTPAMLTKSQHVQMLEQSLADSPSYFGKRIHGQRQKVLDAITDKTDDVLREGAGESPFQVGEEFKRGMIGKLHERIDPATATFDEIRAISTQMPVGERSINSVLNNISKIPEVRLSGGANVSKYTDMISRATSADDLHRISSMINADVRAAQGSEKHLLGLINDKVKNLADNSTMRAAIKVAKEGGMRENTGKKIGTEIVQELRDARSAYRGAAQDFGDVSRNARIKFKGPQTYVDDLEAIASEDIQKKFFNTKDISQLNVLKEKFPEQFELLRRGEIGKISSAIEGIAQGSRGETQVNKFLNQVRKLSPEAQDMILGQGKSVVDDISTVYTNFPKNHNPSGTAKMNALNEILTSNIKDAGKYLYYKGASSNMAGKLGQRAREVAQMSPDAIAIGNATRKLSEPVSRIAVRGASDIPATGPERWISRGAERLTAEGISKEEIENLQSTKQGRALLIEASDAKPNSKRLESVLRRLRTATSQGGQ